MTKMTCNPERHTFRKQLFRKKIQQRTTTTQQGSAVVQCLTQDRLAGVTAL